MRCLSEVGLYSNTAEHHLYGELETFVGFLLLFLTSFQDVSNAAEEGVGMEVSLKLKAQGLNLPRRSSIARRSSTATRGSKRASLVSVEVDASGNSTLDVQGSGFVSSAWLILIFPWAIIKFTLEHLSCRPIMRLLSPKLYMLAMFLPNRLPGYLGQCRWHSDLIQNFYTYPYTDMILSFELFEPQVKSSTWITWTL